MRGVSHSSQQKFRNTSHETYGFFLEQEEQWYVPKSFPIHILEVPLPSLAETRRSVALDVTGLKVQGFHSMILPKAPKNHKKNHAIHHQHLQPPKTEPYQNKNPKAATGPSDPLVPRYPGHPSWSLPRLFPGVWPPDFSTQPLRWKGRREVFQWLPRESRTQCQDHQTRRAGPFQVIQGNLLYETNLAETTHGGFGGGEFPGKCFFIAHCFCWVSTCWLIHISRILQSTRPKCF